MRGAKDGAEMDVKAGRWTREMNAEMRCPCKRCEKREAGCHGRCEEYAAFRLRNENKRERMKRMRLEALGHDLR